MSVPSSKRILASPVFLPPSTHLSTSVSLFRTALKSCRCWSKAVIPFSCLQHALIACLSLISPLLYALQIVIGEPGHDEFRCTSHFARTSLYCQFEIFRSGCPKASILVSTLQFHSTMQRFSLQDATANNNLTFTSNPRSCRLKECMKDGTKRRMR
jgi:hypothetical protein